MLTLNNTKKRLIIHTLMMCFLVILSILTYTKVPSNYPIIKDAKENTIAGYHLINKDIAFLYQPNWAIFKKYAMDCLFCN